MDCDCTYNSLHEKIHERYFFRSGRAWDARVNEGSMCVLHRVACSSDGRSSVVGGGVGTRAQASRHGRKASDATLSNQLGAERPRAAVSLPRRTQTKRHCARVLFFFNLSSRYSCSICSYIYSHPLYTRTPHLHHTCTNKSTTTLIYES